MPEEELQTAAYPRSGTHYQPPDRRPVLHLRALLKERLSAVREELNYKESLWLSIGWFILGFAVCSFVMRAMELLTQFLYNQMSIDLPAGMTLYILLFVVMDGQMHAAQSRANAIYAEMRGEKKRLLYFGPKFFRGYVLSDTPIVLYSIPMFFLPLPLMVIEIVQHVSANLSVILFSLALMYVGFFIGYGALAFTGIAATEEELNPVQAMLKSWRLTRGNRLAIGLFFMVTTTVWLFGYCLLFIPGAILLDWNATNFLRLYLLLKKSEPGAPTPALGHA